MMTKKELAYLITREINLRNREQYYIDSVAATSEDTEPEGLEVGFLREPHKELYPPAWQGLKMRSECKQALKNHVLNAIELEFQQPDKFIYFTVYGSGASYNWDESGDFDIQMWVDIDKFNELHEDQHDTSQDDLVAAIRRIVGPINFPTFKELGLTTDDEEGGKGEMMIQFYPKPGTGAKSENLAQKPYACYDMETDEWYVRPEPIRPQFYGESFLLVEPKAKDVAVQAEAALDELQRNIVDWQFWYAMWKRYKNPKYKERFEDSRDNAEQFKETVKTLFEGVFGGRRDAYSEEGKGIEDERDILQKYLEVWGIFQRLKHWARQPMPWEEQEMPSEDEESDEESKESGWKRGAIFDEPFEWQGEHPEPPSFNNYDQFGQRCPKCKSSDIAMMNGVAVCQSCGWHFLPSQELQHMEYEPTGETVPNTIPWGEEEQNYYRHAAYENEQRVVQMILNNEEMKHDAMEIVQNDTTNYDFVVNSLRMLFEEYNPAWLQDTINRLNWGMITEEIRRYATEYFNYWDNSSSGLYAPFSHVKTATWGEVMDNAKTIRDSGGVQIQNRMQDPDSGQIHTIGQVASQSSPGETYETEIWQDNPNSPAITLWSCDCEWGQHSWGRTRQWKKYEGRPCKHALALYWSSLGTPAENAEVNVPQQPQQPQMGEGPEDWVQAPTTPGGPNMPTQQPLDQPQEIQSDIAQQPTPVELPFSLPQGPADQNSGTIHFPGALSKKAEFQEYKPGDRIRSIWTGQTGTIDTYPQEGYGYFVQWDDEDYSPVEAKDIEPLDPRDYKSIVPDHLPESWSGWKRSDYNGWTNYETWWVAAMIDNEEHLQEYVHKNINYMTPQTLRDWAIINIIGPYNSEVMESAQEYNDMTPEERQEVYPNATAIDFDEDEMPQLIDAELVNWVELLSGFHDDVLEHNQYMDETPTDLTFPEEWKSSGWIRFSAFVNGDIVRNSVEVEGIDRDNRKYTIPRNSAGEVLYSDDETTVVIFPLRENGPLQSHLVRVENATGNFYLSPKFKPFKGR